MEENNLGSHHEQYTTLVALFLPLVRQISEVEAREYSPRSMGIEFLYFKNWYERRY